jgi:hypothetical protein
MEALVLVSKFVIANWDTMIASAVLFVNGMIGVALLIPGAEPERTLGRIVRGLGQISRK